MAHAKKRQPVDVVDLDRRADHIEDSRQQADGNASRLDLAHEVEHVPGGLLRRLDDDPMDFEILDELVQQIARAGAHLRLG